MLCLFFFAFIALTSANPIVDTEIVESTIREVRAVPPRDLLEAATGDNYQDDYSSDDGSVGYLKKTQDGGADGYKHFDSFHKKDGDKYGYEKHTSFGEAKKYEDDSKKKNKGDKDTAATYHVAEELNEYDDGPSHISEYDGAEGEGEHYSGGEGAHYSEGDSGHYTEGGEGEGDADNYSYAKSSSYSSDDGDGESEGEHYTAADEGDEDY